MRGLLCEKSAVANDAALPCIGKATNNSVLLQGSCSLLVFSLCQAVDAYVPALQCNDVDVDGDSCLLASWPQWPFRSHYCPGCKAPDLACVRGFEFDMLQRDVQHIARDICRCVVVVVKCAAVRFTSYGMWLWRTYCHVTTVSCHSL